jgi:hypothetical protein
MLTNQQAHIPQSLATSRQCWNGMPYFSNIVNFDGFRDSPDSTQCGRIEAREFGVFSAGGCA